MHTTLYYVRFKSNDKSNLACSTHELRVPGVRDDAACIEAAKRAARRWGLGNSSTTVSYRVEDYSGRYVRHGVVSVHKKSASKS